MVDGRGERSRVGEGGLGLSTESGSEEELSRGADGASATESNSEREKEKEGERGEVGASLQDRGGRGKCSTGLSTCPCPA